MNQLRNRFCGIFFGAFLRQVITDIRKLHRLAITPNFSPIKLLLFTVNHIIALPGQQILLHTSSRVLLPLQGKPPHEGMGLLHILVAFLIPSPQILLQAPVHELHPPSTTIQRNQNKVYTLYISHRTMYVLIISLIILIKTQL